MLGEERHHRRDDAQRLHEREPEHVQRDASPSQKRRRERRMYQLERSSTNSSNARITSTVRKAS